MATRMQRPIGLEEDYYIMFVNTSLIFKTDYELQVIIVVH